MQGIGQQASIVGVLIGGRPVANIRDDDGAIARSMGPDDQVATRRVLPSRLF